jgi:hypothetical protein
MSNVDFLSCIIKRIFFSLLCLKSEMTILTSENKDKIVNSGTLGHFTGAEKKHEKSKMKWLIGLQICTIIMILLMIGTFCLTVYPKMKEWQVITSATHNNSEHKESIVTMYALDPLARTFCFRDGRYGHELSDWSVYNRDSEIDFDSYKNGSFSVGIQGGQVGTIIDLGSNAYLQKKYKYSETVGNGQGYASIHRKNNTLLILKAAPYNHTFQRMEESNELFREGTSGASASVNLGHLYVLRITDYSQTAFEHIVKMLVIAYKPNESVTIRWDILA